MYATGTKSLIGRHGRLIALGVTGCALVIAGCGSSAKPVRAGNASTYAQGVRYSDCMRSHGVPNYPDPNTGGRVPQQTSGISPDSPAYQSAQKACARLHPGGSAATPSISGAQRAGMIANARCIRRHGVPSFPDPIFGSGGAIGVGVLPNEGSSPAFKGAQKACEHVGIPLPGVG
jgi:hypothetical protein